MQICTFWGKLTLWPPNGALLDAHPAPSVSLLYGQRRLWLPDLLGILEAQWIHVHKGGVCGQSFLKLGDGDGQHHFLLVL